MVLVIGHRGAAAHAPENTLPSFRRAMELGADMVELDVHLSSDGELVVIHDDTLDRTTNGNGLVSSKTLKELRDLDAGGGERIPTLGEVVSLVGGRCGLDIELKGASTAGPVASLLMEVIGEGAFREQGLLITSFNPLELLDLGPLLPDVRRGILVEGVPDGVVEVAGMLSVNTIGPDHRFMTEGLVRECLRSGFEVHAWTVNDIERARALAAWGVGAIITDRPELRDGLSGRTREG
jgi:glycerophosphoryl diester phosphodiesterase